MIGTNYIVGNKGLSGSTLLTNGDLPYFGSTTFAGSQKFSPGVFVIMLGSNDSKPQNWVYGTNFYSNYVNLIGEYTNLTSHPRILLCTPPPVFNDGAFAINPGIVATNISPLIRQLGSDLGLQVIDMQTLLAGHGEWFPDNVHPNSQGAMVMAAIVYAAVSGDTMNGAFPSRRHQHADKSQCHFEVARWRRGLGSPINVQISRHQCLADRFQFRGHRQ